MQSSEIIKNDNEFYLFGMKEFDNQSSKYVVLVRQKSDPDYINDK